MAVFWKIHAMVSCIIYGYSFWFNDTVYNKYRSANVAACGTVLSGIFSV